jgi:predicted aspartyl protease
MIGERALAIAAILLSSALFAPALAADPPQDCRLRAAAQVPMQIMPDGRVTIPVQLEGHNYRFMIDTGGFINTVSQRVVAEEGYTPKVTRGTTLRGMGISLLTNYITAKEFMIGRSRGADFEFFVDDFNDLSSYGTLAPQVLATYDVDLDFGHDKFNLFYPDHCPGVVTYWTDAPVAVVPIEIQNLTHIRIPVMIDGKKIMALLDTGATGAHITQRAARRFLGIEKDDAALKALGPISINGMSAPVFSYPFKTLGFGDAATGNITVNNPRIEIISDQVWGDDDLLLGVNILRQLHMYIAYKERRMYLTPALAGKTAN